MRSLAWYGRSLLLSAVLSLCLTGCGGDGKGNPVSEHTHDWGAWEVTTPATCDAAGVETRTCKSDATHKETQSIPKLTGSACNPIVVESNNCGKDGTANSCKSVTIDGQTWLAENLNYESGNSWCYGDSAASCNRYGRLYDWETAKTVCPAGWKLPDASDWKKLVTAAGGIETAGKRLKSSSGWKIGSSSWMTSIGTDDFQFSALPGGSCFLGADFGSAGEYGTWWSSEVTDAGVWWMSVGIYYLSISYYSDRVMQETVSYDEVEGIGFSVRCVKTD